MKMRAARREVLFVAAAIAARLVAGCGGADAVGGPAAAPARAPTRAGTILVTLGTRGGPMPTADRAQSANLVIVDGTPYLIDAGDGVLRRVVEAGVDFRAIDHVFLTHVHWDHAGGLAALVAAAWESQRRTPIEVFASGAEAVVAGVVASLTPNAEIKATTGKATPLGDVVRAHEAAPGAVYQDDRITVTAVENTHFHFAADSPLVDKYRSYALRIATADRVIVFTGDTGESTAVETLARGADVLVAEVLDPDDVVALAQRRGTWQKMTATEQAGLARHLRASHLTPEQVGQLAAAAGVGEVILTHLVPTPDPVHDDARYVERVRATYHGPVVLAEDLGRY